MQGFFFHGIAKPNATDRRNGLVDAHRAYLMPKDNTNCLSRGPLTDKLGTGWFGSAMVYEFPDRKVFDDFFENEPFCNNELYENVAVYNWQRGAI